MVAHLESEHLGGLRQENHGLSFFFFKQPVLHKDFLSKAGEGCKSILMDICNTVLKEIIGLKLFLWYNTITELDKA